MATITVTTKGELKKAKELKADKIIVKGELAKSLKKAQSICSLSKKKLAVLSATIGAAAAAAPASGGLSMVAAAPIAALTGLEIAAIIAAVSLGLGLIIALFLEYEEISYRDGILIIKKRQTQEKENNKEAVNQIN